MKNLYQKLCFIALLLTSLNAYCQVPKLNSFETAQPTIFLDFDGQTVQSAAWMSGNAFICAPAVLTNTQIIEIFNRVSEDYRPFTINITTDSTKYFAAPPQQRIRVIVTPTSGFLQGVGGASYTGSFTWGSEVPSFVFPDRLANSPKIIAECCSHESGHSLGLSHQSKYDAGCTLLEVYNTGIGTGQTSWAPVMGNSYYKNMTGWNDGPTQVGCTSPQDNLSTITSTQNGIAYRVDDYTEALDNNTYNLNPVSFNQSGIITTQNDKDAFKIVLTKASLLHIDALPYSAAANCDGANLDLVLMLYNSSNSLIKTYNPASSMNVTVDTILNAGTYYIVTSGGGNDNATNYGSLGSYTITGSTGVLAIHDVSLQGSSEKNVHKLSWSILADEAIAKQVLELSTNGSDFSPILTDYSGIKKYTYTAPQKGTSFYRLKATSVINESIYSNILALKAGSDQKLFNVSTIVQQNIQVIASENYNYNLYDANGRLAATGKGKIGSSNINVSNLSSGMFVLQLLTNNNIQTERIIRQ
jgi:hypothetical protein